MDLCFYNSFHNGDVHFSREFVKDIIRKTNYDNYLYSHNLPIGILKDIKEIREINDRNIIHNEDDRSPKTYDNTTIINTWIAQQNVKFGEYGVTLMGSYSLFEDIYEKMGLKIEKDVDYYIPSINYENIDKINVNSFLKEKKNKLKVLICNSRTLSNQSYELKIEKILPRLADEFKDVVFIVTDPFNINFSLYNNVFLTDGITKIKPDLNEISYLSTHCDIIFGSCSGPNAFSMVKDNFVPNKTMIYYMSHPNYIWYNPFYSNDVSKFTTHEWYLNGSKNIWLDNHSLIYSTIKNEILNK